MPCLRGRPGRFFFTDDPLHLADAPGGTVRHRKTWLIPRLFSKLCDEGVRKGSRKNNFGFSGSYVRQDHRYAAVPGRDD